MSGSTKHKTQNLSWGPQYEPESVHGNVGTLLDDMKVQKYVCLPLKPKKHGESAITFGDDPVDYSRDRFPGLPGETENLEDRRRRAAEMTSRHFEFGDEPFMGKQAMRPPTKEELLSRNVCPIGAPNDKGRSNVFVPPDGVEDWRKDLISESRRNFTAPDSGRADPGRAISKDMNATHFVLGEEPATYETSRQQYAAATARPQKAANHNNQSSVPLADKGAPGWTTTNCAAFSAPATDGRPQAARPPHTQIVFGTDPKELKTTQRGSYKQPKFVDCEAYTDAELKALGLVRFMVADVPTEYRDTPEYSKAVMDLQNHKEFRKVKMAGSEGSDYAESQQFAPGPLPAPSS